MSLSYAPSVELVCGSSHRPRLGETSIVLQGRRSISKAGGRGRYVYPVSGVAIESTRVRDERGLMNHGGPPFDR
jgi:hypothetical protein